MAIASCKISISLTILADSCLNSNPSNDQKKDVGLLQGQLIRIRTLPPIVALQILTRMNSSFVVEDLFMGILNRGLEGLGGDVQLYSGSLSHTNQCWSFTIRYYYLN